MTDLTSLNVEPTYPREVVWEQMFRPRDIDDVALPESHRSAFNKFREEGRIPSLIFYSPMPGTGKTTTARALANAVGCPDPLFINASKDNSIENIRSTVEQYGSTVAAFGVGAQKVVILDECERLSPPAQEALKGMMEHVSSNCSFILTTNDISSVNNPLLSRCRRFDFIWTTGQAAEVELQITRRIIGILNNRKVPYDPKAVIALVKRDFPDNRSLLGSLDTYRAQAGKIDMGVLNMVIGLNFDQLHGILSSKDFRSAAQWAIDNHEAMGRGAYGKLFRYLNPYNSKKPLITDASVPALVAIINEAQKPKNMGVDTYVHLLATLSEIMACPEIVFNK